MLQTGDLIAARYRIEKRLGQGGFATVFQAMHLGTERSVAVKVLGVHAMEMADTLEKFQLEAKVSARLQNEHIVEVFDAGFDEGRQCAFLVMELLEGETLASRVRQRGRLEARETLALLRQAANGLDAAHGYQNAQGQRTPIVHRDLKPENLFLHRRRDGSEMLKILDFGIAKVINHASIHLTLAVRGTPPFMAPEQVNPAPASPQTDVWALGLIAHFMLAGQHYWRCMARPECTAPELFGEIMSLRRESPRSRLRERGNPVLLPAAFDAWLLRCIEQVPSARFASVGAAVAALTLIFDDEALDSPRETLREGSLPVPERPVPERPVPERPLNFATKSFEAAVAPMRPSTTGSLSSVAREGFKPRTERRVGWAPFAAVIAGVLAIGGLLAWWLRAPALDSSGRRADAPLSNAPPPSASGSEPKPAVAGDAIRSVVTEPSDAQPTHPRTPTIAPVLEQAQVAPEPTNEPANGVVKPSDAARAARAARANEALPAPGVVGPAPAQGTRREPAEAPVAAPPARTKEPSAKTEQAPKPALDPYNIAPHELAPAAPPVQSAPVQPPPKSPPKAPASPEIDPYNIAPDELE